MKESTSVQARNGQLLVEFLENVWNHGRERGLKEIDKTYHEQGVARGLGDKERYLEGPAAFKLLHGLLHDTCENIKVRAEPLLAAGNRVTVHGVVTMTHKATKTPLRFEGLGVAEIEGKKIVKAWNGWSFLDTLSQLGILPPNGLQEVLENPEKYRPEA